MLIATSPPRRRPGPRAATSCGRGTGGPPGADVVPRTSAGSAPSAWRETAGAPKPSSRAWWLFQTKCAPPSVCTSAKLMRAPPSSAKPFARSRRWRSSTPRRTSSTARPRQSWFSQGRAISRCTSCSGSSRPDQANRTRVAGWRRHTRRQASSSFATTGAPNVHCPLPEVRLRVCTCWSGCGRASPAGSGSGEARPPPIPSRPTPTAARPRGPGRREEWRSAVAPPLAAPPLRPRRLPPRSPWRRAGPRARQSSGTRDLGADSGKALAPGGRHDLDAGDRVSADLEEVVVDANRVELEDFRPDGGRDVARLRSTGPRRRKPTPGGFAAESGRAARSTLPFPVSGSSGNATR